MFSTRSPKLSVRVLVWSVIRERSGWHSSRSDIRRCTGVSTRWTDLHWDWRSSLSEYLLDSISSTTDTTLSKAAKDVSGIQDALTTVFERIENFFRRLETYVQVPPTTGMTDIIVKIMIQVLSILAIATREINQSRASKLIARLYESSRSTDCCSEKYLKKVAGMNGIEDALAQLDLLTQEEFRMAAAQGLKATDAVRGEVKTVGSNVQQVGIHVQRVDDKVQQVADDIGDQKS